MRCVSFNGDLTSLKSTTGGAALDKQYVTKKCQELIKNANLLFNTLQTYYIWSFIEKKYKDSVAGLEKTRKIRDKCQVNEIGTSGAPSVVEVCVLADFLLDIVPIESHSDQNIDILPSLFMTIVTSLKNNMAAVSCAEIERSLLLCTRILTKIQPAVEVIQNGAPSGVIVSGENEKPLRCNVDETPINNSNNNNNRIALEKSKSDSRINENLLTVDSQEDSSRERSYSNQMSSKKKSPGPNKKTKNKKAKSNSKLYDLNKNDEERGLNDISVTIDDSSVSLRDDLSVSLTDTITVKIEQVKIENKHLIDCLKLYKEFYLVFVRLKILPPEMDYVNFVSKFGTDNKNDRIEKLIELLRGCLGENRRSSFTPVDFRQILPQTSNLTGDNNESIIEIQDGDYKSAMKVACDVLLEFSAFSLSIEEERMPPDWLQILIAAACSRSIPCDVQIIAMTTLLEIFSLAKNRNCKDGGRVVIIGGILGEKHVVYVEENTVVIEVRHQ